MAESDESRSRVAIWWDRTAATRPLFTSRLNSSRPLFRGGLYSRKYGTLYLHMYIYSLHGMIMPSWSVMMTVISLALPVIRPCCGTMDTLNISDLSGLLSLSIETSSKHIILSGVRRVRSVGTRLKSRPTEGEREGIMCVCVCVHACDLIIIMCCNYLYLHVPTLLHIIYSCVQVHVDICTCTYNYA